MMNWWTLVQAWWNEWSAWWWSAIGSLLVMLGIGGCGIVNTGPAVAQATVEGASGGLKALMSQYQPDQMHADVSLSVNDPCYEVEAFVGVGTYVVLKARLVGAEAEIEVKSSGKGVEIPLKVKTELLSIIGNHSISEEQRSTMIVETIMGLVNQQPKAPLATDEKDEPPGKATDEKPSDESTSPLKIGKATDADAEADGAFAVAMGPPAPQTVMQANGEDVKRVTFWDGNEVSRERVEPP